MRRSMKAEIWRMAGVLTFAILCVAMIATVNPASAKKGGGGGGGGGDTPPVLPIVALFEDDGDDNNGLDQITMNGPLPITDAEESDTNGHSHLAQTGNFTLQLGGGSRKKAKESDRELTFDFEGNPILQLDEMFMPINRKYCRDGDPDGDPSTCSSADQWYNSPGDGTQPGLREMEAGEDVPVSVSLWPREGLDYRMSCTESSNDTFGTEASDVTEFATARCIAEVDGAPGTCQQWAIFGEGDTLSCGLWLDGSMVGVFDMNFRLQLCREDIAGVADDCLGLWPGP